MSLIRIIYESTSSKDMDKAELAELLDVCERNNLKSGITGMLLYRGRRFMQVIEGEAASVDALMAKIKADTRHGSVTVLERCVIRAKDFPQWHMGFREVSDEDVSADPTFKELLDLPPGSRMSHIRFGAPLIMLKAFAKGLPL